jgi:hypothetical protein
MTSINLARRNSDTNSAIPSLAKGDEVLPPQFDAADQFGATGGAHVGMRAHPAEGCSCRDLLRSPVLSLSGR